MVAINRGLNTLFYGLLELCKAAPLKAGILQRNKWIFQSFKINKHHIIIAKVILKASVFSGGPQCATGWPALPGMQPSPASTVRLSLRPADDQLTVRDMKFSQSCLIWPSLSVHRTQSLVNQWLRSSRPSQPSRVGLPARAAARWADMSVWRLDSSARLRSFPPLKVSPGQEGSKETNKAIRKGQFRRFNLEEISF